ncbi:MarR family transcriptional regulator [Nonomuraea sp. NBC_01738]|uniref:MarR family transcriptional regulator n=1 Tax=Nonomuraea sp. NBC_01738 TaxID=2976003 RepID=UPI002E1256D0|nr:MarR family transcriptional regulator [Nonomuraea sp. NBC_01738]
MDSRTALSEEVQANQSAVDAFDEAVAVYLSVNRTDLRCLDVLSRTEAATPTQLGAALGLTTGSVTAMLDRLEKLGYLTRSPDPSDRRKVIVRATPVVGEAAIVAYGPIAEEGMRLLDGYTDEQVDLLLDFTRRTRELYDQQLARIQALAAQKRATRG